MGSSTLARTRLAALFDGGQFTELDALRQEKGGPAAVVCAQGYVDGAPVCAFAQASDIADGAMGQNAAGKIRRLYALAAKTGTPVVGIFDSCGSYIDGSAEPLTVWGKLIASAAKLSGVVPQISVIAGVCAGSAAIMALSADFVLMTKNAELYLTPPFGTDAATVEAAEKAGLVAAAAEDDEAALTLAKEILQKLPANNLAGVPVCEFAEPGTPDPDACVCRRIADADSVIPLYKGFGTAAGTALGTVRGQTVGFVTTCRSEEPLTIDDCVKMARFVRTCDAFSIPVITIADTPGFTADTDAAKAGALRAVTQLCGAYAEATTVKIALICGQACGAAFSAIAGRGAGSDYVIAWDSAVIAPMRPESAVEFLWHDRLKGAVDANAKRKELAKEYGQTLASAEMAAKIGAADAVIAKEQTREAICAALEMLEGKRVSRLPKKHSSIAF